MTPTCRELLDLRASGMGMTQASPDGNPMTLLAARVERVLALHVEFAPHTHPVIYHTMPICGACETAWPCPTVRLLDGQEPGDS